EIELGRGIDIAELAVNGEGVAPVGRRRISGDEVPGEAERLRSHATLVGNRKRALVEFFRRTLAAALGELKGPLRQLERLLLLVEAKLHLGELADPLGIVRVLLEQPRERRLGSGEIVRLDREGDLGRVER